MPHVPTVDIRRLGDIRFDTQLEKALAPSPDYDVQQWLFVPNEYTEYRYILGTRGKKPLICIGINPSTARPGDLRNSRRHPPLRLPRPKRPAPRRIRSRSDWMPRGTGRGTGACRMIRKSRRSPPVCAGRHRARMCVAGGTQSGSPNRRASRRMPPARRTVGQGAIPSCTWISATRTNCAARRTALPVPMPPCATGWGGSAMRLN